MRFLGLFPFRQITPFGCRGRKELDDSRHGVWGSYIVRANSGKGGIEGKIMAIGAGKGLFQSVRELALTRQANLGFSEESLPKRHFDEIAWDAKQPVEKV